jgi:hypothetical protein
VLRRANAIASQVYLVSSNYGGFMGTGRSLLVDPEGHVLTSAGSGEHYAAPRAGRMAQSPATPRAWSRIPSAVSTSAAVVTRGGMMRTTLP